NDALNIAGLTQHSMQDRDQGLLETVDERQDINAAFATINTKLMLQYTGVNLAVVNVIGGAYIIFLAVLPDDVFHLLRIFIFINFLRVVKRHHEAAIVQFTALKISVDGVHQVIIKSSYPAFT